MKGISLILACFTILVLPSIVSAELLIQSNPIDVQVRANEQKTFQLIVQNTFPFKIIDFQFSNLTGFNFPQISLEPNETKTIAFTVQRSDSGLQTINSKVSFKYLIDLPEGVSTHFINITSSGYHPDFLVVRRGDTVTWFNQDTISRSATSAKFDYTIAPNLTASYQFNQIEEVPYQDLILFFAGTIQVINETSEEKINNPQYDKTLTINLEVTTDPTTLEVINNERNYTIEATKSKEGLLEIRNTGTKVAQRVKLIAEPSWVQFSKDSFDIEAGEKSFVTYKISPSILEERFTNQTYSLSIKTQASNSEPIFSNLTIFVPFSNIFSNFDSNEGFISWFSNVYCPTHPNILFCNNTIQSSGNGSIIVRDTEIPINLSAREVYVMLKRIQGIEDSNSRTDNKLKEVSDLLQTQFPEFSQKLNDSYNKQLDNENTSTSRTRTFWIGTIFVIICLCILSIAFLIRKYYSKKNLLDGGYNLKP